MNSGYKELNTKQNNHSSPTAYLGLPDKSGLNASNVPYFVNDDEDGGGSKGIGLDSISEGGAERKDEDSRWRAGEVEVRVKEGK